MPDETGCRASNPETVALACAPKAPCRARDPAVRCLRPAASESAATVPAISRTRTQTFKKRSSHDAPMRAWPVVLLLLLLPMLALALAGDQLPPAPGTPDPTSIPITTGPLEGAGVRFLTPPSAVTGPTVHVSYRHNATGTHECLVTIDDADWADDDPRWNDDAVAKYATVAPSTVRNETFTAVLPGTHLFSVYCIDDAMGVPLIDYRQTVVAGNLTSNTSANATVTITSPGSTTGPNVTIAFRHTAMVSGICNLTIDARHLIAVVAPPQTATTYLTTASTGSHQLTVACTGASWSASATTTFRVRTGADGNGTNSTRDPRLRLEGGGSSVLANTPFTLLGDRFLPDSLVLLTLTGGGITDEGEIDTAGDGTFAIDHDGLPSGTYRILAEDFDDQDVSAVLVITARAANTTAPDADKDSVPDAEDNCPYQKNTDQADADWDGIGDACDATDADGDDDGLPDTDDNCPLIYNPSQADEDWNGVGDACDTSGGGTPPDDGWVDDGNADDDITYPTPVTSTLEQPSDVRWWLWLIPLLVVILFVGGTAGYLVHEGTLDISSWDDFRSSVRDLLHGPPGRRSATATLPQATAGAIARSPFARQPTPQERATVRGFITKERQGGIDDLAIRSALLGKGWDKHMVDAVFDDLYRERQAPKTAQPATGLPKAPPQK